MLRTSTALAAFGLLVLVFVIGLYNGHSAVTGPQTGPMISAGNGQTITLEMIQKDIDWHRETAEKLRNLD